MEVKESKARLCECMYVYIVETACWCVNNVHQPSHISGYTFATQTQQTCTHMDATTYSSHVPATTIQQTCAHGIDQMKGNRIRDMGEHESAQSQI